MTPHIKPKKLLYYLISQYELTNNADIFDIVTKFKLDFDNDLLPDDVANIYDNLTSEETAEVLFQFANFAVGVKRQSAITKHKNKKEALTIWKASTL